VEPADWLANAVADRTLERVPAEEVPTVVAGLGVATPPATLGAAEGSPGTEASKKPPSKTSRTSATANATIETS
jgi:hypothetical protein